MTFKHDFVRGFICTYLSMALTFFIMILTGIYNHTILSFCYYAVVSITLYYLLWNKSFEVVK